MRGWGLAGGLLAASALFGAVVKTSDMLVLKNGDRLHGRFLKREGGTLVFQSDSFGEVRVPADGSELISASAPSPAATVGAMSASARMPAKVAVTRGADEAAGPSDLTARVREFFGPWHGRLAASSELVTDSAERSSYALEVSFRRKWTNDEVQLTSRYDYAEVNDVPRTEVFKAGGSWHHDFAAHRQFAQYRPTLEWNRANSRSGLPNDYVLLQQEIGSGLTLLSSPRHKIRAGISQSLFDLWSSVSTVDHVSRGAQSTFEEVELALPWRMNFSQRAVWYPLRERDDGWEGRVELNKKFTETLSASLRHEIRRNNPDGLSQDYTRLKLLLGLDF